MVDANRPPAFAPSQLAPTSAAPRPGVIQLSFKEKGALYAAYMPFLDNGGLFVPTQRPAQLGDASDDKHRQIKHKIEELLGTSISSSKPTQTI